MVLVGHSQGSVLAAWVTYQRGKESAHSLVTCGSPLAGLYGTFFPAEFPPEWFDAVTDRKGRWVNVWRDTDPISAPIAALEPDGNRQLDDTRKPVNSHSNYWDDTTQAAEVAGML